ncbi:MAG: ATP-binding cassette domain-containing protein [Chloroflexi bacterium]|nr:ATP-binding cassette domain-containing protein [Chloroflexota bacterium]
MTRASLPASETVLRVKDLTKTFGRRTVVDGVSFDVRRGEMFGFLGPNGSGKTTTIRMALGIIRPDAGSIGILGSPPERSVLRAVGYLPEERGLPRKLRVLDALRYLGRLKGLTVAEAEDRAIALLQQLDLDEHYKKRVEALSRGMTQLVQFAAAIIHAPEFIVLDEPFAGLDPLNVERMKEMLFERQRTGATIMFSTHIMSDVEELCDRVALIADGHLLLFGDLAEIKRQRGANAVLVQAPRVPEALTAGRPAVARSGVVEHVLEGGSTPEAVLRAYLDAGISVERFELALPTLNDIFIEEVSRARSIS